MASLREWVLGGALVASLGANVWLARRSSAEASSSSSVSSAPDEKMTQSGSATSPASITSTAPARASGAGRRSAPQLGSAAGPCAAVEAQLASTEAELDKYLPADERYARYPRDEASEVKIKPFLEAVFIDGGKGRGYAVECHERVCKIDVDRKIARKDWMEAIQMHPMNAGLIEHGSFGPETYMTLKEKPPTPNEQLENALGAAMTTRAKAFEGCVAAHKEPGTLRLTISLDAASHRLSLTFTDSLANSPLAACLRPLLESTIAETKVPPDATELSWSAPIEVP